MEKLEKAISLLQEAIDEGVLADTNPSSYFYDEKAADWEKRVEEFLDNVGLREISNELLEQIERAERAEDEAATLAGEVLELREIVSKLPKTADGVAVIPGMVVYYISPSGIVETPKIDSWCELEGMLMEDDLVGPVPFYSTRKAAEKAMEKNNEIS